MSLGKLIRQAGNVFALSRAKYRALPSPFCDGSPAPVAWFDLFSHDLLFDGARHLHSLAMQFIELGYLVAIVDRNRLAQSLMRKLHGASTLQAEGVYVVNADQKPPTGAMIVTDSRESQHQAPSIQVHVSSGPVANSSVFPFPVHPAVRQHMTPLKLATGRSCRRRGRMFFCGNQKSSYANQQLAEQFGVCTRTALLARLRQSFSELCELMPASRKLPVTFDRPVMIGDSRKHPIDHKDWLEALSNFEFFIGCPGRAHPMCHNVVEAMSVGTIPILEHGHLFTPSLIDGENAILFSSLDGFENAVRRVLAMTDTEMRHLRKGAIEYYDAFLKGDQFMHRLLLTARFRGRVVLSLPYHHRDLGDASWPQWRRWPNVAAKPTENIPIRAAA
jgi:hypothetical protein